MKKNISCIILLACAAFLFSGCGFLGKKVVQLESKLSELKEDIVPLRFEITENQNKTIKVKVNVYDCATDTKIGSKSIQLDGSELHVDFQVIQLSEINYLFFPVGLYTETMTIKDSEKLYDLYDKNDFPKIYAGMVDLNKRFFGFDKAGIKKQLSDYFVAVKQDAQTGASKQYGMAIHDMKTVSRFKTGFVYKVVCHPHRGGMEIVKD